MDTEIMDYILGWLDRQLKLENHHVVLFLDNIPRYPQTLQDHMGFIKMTFLPKNAISELQSANAEIIGTMKAKYRKRLVRNISLLNDENTVSTIIKQVTVIDAIRWVKASWDEVNKSTNCDCFKKCGFFHMERGTGEDQDDAEPQDLF